MSWLQQIIDRDPDDAITVPDDPEMVELPGPDMHPPSFEESAFLVSQPEADAVPDPDAHARRGKSILIVEDESVVANDIKETLKSLGYDVAGIAKSGEDALKKVNELRPDLVLMDIHLATAMDGIETAGKIHQLYDTPVIYLTAFADKALIDRAKVTEPYGYIIKPYDERELRSTIDIAFHKHKLDLQLKNAYGELEQRVAERTVELEQINRALSESEQRYRNLFEGVPIGIYRTTISGQILNINPALVSLLGYPNREMLMKVDVSDIYMNPEDRNRWLSLIEREGIVRDFEVRFRKYDGTIIWVKDTGKAIYDDKGQVLYYNGNVEDITDRKQAEEAQKQSERRLIDIIDHLPDATFAIDRTGTVIAWNKAIEEMTGVNKEAILGKGNYEYALPFYSAKRPMLINWILDTGKKTDPREYQNFKKIGQIIYAETKTVLSNGKSVALWGKASPLNDINEDLIGAIESIRDVTEQKRAEEALRESRQILEAVLNTIPVRVFWKDRNSVYLGCNTAFARDAGFERPEEIIGKDDFALVWQEQAELYRYDDRAVIESGNPELLIEEPMTTPSGERIHLLTSKVPLTDATGEIMGVLGIYLDITERKRMEDALNESEQRFRAVFDAARDGIIVMDKETHRFVMANASIQKQTGYSEMELLSLSKSDIHPQADQPYVIDKFEKQTHGDIALSYDIPVLRKDGTVFFADIRFSVVTLQNRHYLLGIFRDITKRKAAEEALRMSEQRYRAVVEDQTEFICRFLPDGRLTFINEAYCNYFRLNRKEIIGKRHSVVLLPDDARLMKNHLAALTPENPVAWISHRIEKPSGEVRWHRWSDRAIYDKNDEVIEYQSVGRDITSLKETEIQLKNYKETLEQRVRDRTSELSETNLKLKKEIEDRKIIQKKLTLSSDEKDLLLREVHHRVKNNLQLIIGLIDMTKTRAHEPAVISTLTDIMAKVQTMGSIHTRLYESKRFDKINMKRQVHDLVEMISGFHDHDHLDITTNIDCAEIYLPVDQAIPCALALNEIISNIHKHAFSGRRNGLVDISSVKKADRIRFIIQDNGVGLPSGFNIEKSNRLGLKLMRTLVEQQLHGSVQITSKAGTEVVIEFPIMRGEPDYGKGTGS
ncbi:MAG: PAS domain S-box protein [Methanoregula sp.]|nr:PAS domain S-box protein [Methanoregula sp.]